MAKSTNDDHKKWYEENRSKYELLSNVVKTTLESLIKDAGIPFLNITTRAKELDSFAEKIRRKNYQDPAQEITDLAGIRVVTFIEADALKVNDLIKDSFDVDDSKSLDKSNELGFDKFGYRSFHFICGLGKVRCALPEFKNFKKLVCEIQVRTVLQHAWAEIEHDRNYKFAGELPSQIKRRLHLLAGLLELADGEFNKISSDIDDYAEKSLQKTKSGDLDIEINSISLEQYINESENVKTLIENAKEAYFVIWNVGDNEALINVCKFLNISSIDEIDKILISSKKWMKDFLIMVKKQNTEIMVWLEDTAILILFVIVANNLSLFDEKIFTTMTELNPRIFHFISTAYNHIKK